MERADLEGLYAALRQTRQVALIIPHNDPDPDAIASAAALQHLLRARAGIESRIVYRGVIGRAENKALVEHLGSPLHLLTESDLHSTEAILLIDTQPGAGNNPLPAHRTPVVVIDHHPYVEGGAGAMYSDITPELGACSTILTRYLQAAGIEPPLPLATALFYGIKTDTRALGRGVHQADIDAYFYLQPRIDVEALAEIEYAQAPPVYFKSLVRTLQTLRIYDGVVSAYVGDGEYPDMAAEMADFLLRIEKTRWVISGVAYQGRLFVSVRTRDPQGRADRLIRKMVGLEGSAGGHGMLAGGMAYLDGEDPARLWQQLVQRALQYLGVPPGLLGRPLFE